METFPTSFPAPDVNYNIDEAPNSIRTAMDSGIVRQRRRFLTDQVQVRVNWTLSDTECGVLVAWHKFKINLGNDYFIMPLPVGGDGFQPHVVRFVDGRFSQQHIPVGYWQVSALLEIKERYTFSLEVLEFYLAVGFSDAEILALEADALAFHYFLTVTYPPTQSP